MAEVMSYTNQNFDYFFIFSFTSYICLYTNWIVLLMSSSSYFYQNVNILKLYIHVF